MEGLRWLKRTFEAISLIVGVSIFAIAVFLLDQRWDIAVILGLLVYILAIHEGSWRQSCKEKDALDPEWRSKYGRQKKI